ncbi:MAG: helix-turn-helix domain-containing protein [Bacteroidota bacterium]
MTARQVAALLQMDQRTIYKLAKRGELPSFKVTNQWRFLRKDIETWVEKKKREILARKR